MGEKVISINKLKIEKQYKQVYTENSMVSSLNIPLEIFSSKKAKQKTEDIRKAMTKGYMKMLVNFNHG